MLGSIIKQERIKLDMKQEFLCHGICSVSYLSKIENEQAQASEEVIQLLFSKLDIEYRTEVDSIYLENLFDEIENYVFYEDFDEVKMDSYLNKLRTFKYSRFYWDVYLRELLLNLFVNSEFEMSEAIPDKLLYHPYIAIHYALNHIKSDEVEEAIRRLLLAKGHDETGMVDFSLSQSYFYFGKFDQSLRFAHESLSTFSRLGNVRMMMNAHFQLANGYVYSDFDIALQHFKSCRRIATILDNSYIHHVLDYNLGADYLAQYFHSEDGKHLDKAREFIMSAYEYENSRSIDMYEKVILIHLYSNEIDEAILAFEALKKYAELDASIGASPEYAALEYAVSHPNFNLDKEYAKLIEEVYTTNKKSRIYTRAIFIKSLLIFVYRSQKRYKRALELMDFPV